MPERRFLAVLGPGILYAAAAVGVSHLVHATRAGALYGLALLPFILLFCLVKYPALRFGSEFAAATGRSLVDGYLSFGRWAVWVYGLSQVLSMVFVVAAVSLVASGLLTAVLGIAMAPLVTNACLLAIAALILVTGRYHLLERLTKGIVLLFTLLILLATLSALGKLQWPVTGLGLSALDTATLLYIVALAGFMPTPLDASVHQSLWARAKVRDSGRAISQADARLDFNIGFLTTVVLAICFVLLGMAVMYGSGVALEKSAGGFARQLIALFTNLVGDWAYYPIGLAAIAVMLSTLLTVMDGYPRVIEAIAVELLPGQAGKCLGRRYYDWIMLFICLMSMVVLSVFMTSFAAFIDMTSVIAFLIGPLIAWLNHRSMFGSQVPVDKQPHRLMRLWSAASIVFMLLVALVYLYLRVTA